MFRKYLVPVLLISAFATPALAASEHAATEHYVVMNTATKKCEVTSKKPDGTTMTQVGTMTYKTKKEAHDAMKAAAECSMK